MRGGTSLLKRSAALVFLAAMASCAPANVPLPPRPETAAQLLQNIRYGMDHRFFLDRRFYTDENLKNFFGASEVRTTFYEKGRPRPFKRIDLYDFGHVLPPVKMAGGRSVSSVELDLIINTADDKEDGQEVILLRATLFLHPDQENVADLGDIGFDAVTKTMGPNWVEDRQAEDDKFMAVAREAWNPPATPSLIIKYQSTDRGIGNEMHLDFGGNKFLESFSFAQGHFDKLGLSASK